MNEHKTSITRSDGVTKYGQRKRQYTATCSCGWRSDWSPVQKFAAEQTATEHAQRADR